MEIYEITGYRDGVNRSGVNFLQPSESFQAIENGLIYRQELKSRKGFVQFSKGQLADQTRVLGIFENILPDSSKQLLAITRQFLYIYNSVTNTFNQVPMAGSAPGGGFNITLPDAYVSGTSYPTSGNAQRFVFTSLGMSDVYFFDGTDVKSFTLDNPNYQAPAGGTLNKALYVAFFGSRLNFFAPFIAGLPNYQTVLFSGIQNITGNGDKFNIPGAGSVIADTYQYMTGAVVAGDYMVLEFDRSTYTLEKTRDAFNPYFIRKIPGVLGTDANFSAVSWNNETLSLGKTGILITDGRTSLRRDDKIPYFTSQVMEQAGFNLSYGGFDRINAQFVFAYRSINASLSEFTQDKVLTFNYEEHSWTNNDMRLSCFGQTDQGQNLAWNDINETNSLSWARMDQTEEIWNQIGIGVGVQKTLAGDNNGFIYELNSDYDDYFVDITAITQATSAVITISPANFRVGDVISIANVQGMTQINGMTATILAIGSLTSITVNIDTTTFTSYTMAGSVQKIINFSALTIPFNPYRSEGRMVRVSHVEFLINSNAGNLLVSIFENEQQAPFKADVLLQPYATTQSRQWLTCIVDNQANFMTFQMKQQSANSQLIIYSIRIHAERGKVTNG